MASALYLAQRARPGRVAMWALKLVVGRCGESYADDGTACGMATGNGGPGDQGDGNRCSRTWPTCPVRDTFSLDSQTWWLTSSSVHVPSQLRADLRASVLAAGAYVLPVLDKVGTISQEIDPEASLTLQERMTFHLRNPVLSHGGNDKTCPELDRDMALHNTSQRGLLWHRFLSAHENLRGSEVVLLDGFHAYGYAGLADFEERWRGKDETWRTDEQGSLRLECIDLMVETLKEIPRRIDTSNTVQSLVLAGDNVIPVADASQFTNPSDVPLPVAVSVENWLGQWEDYRVTAVDTGANELTVDKGYWGLRINEPIEEGAAIKEVLILGTERFDSGVEFPDAIAHALRLAGTPAADIDTGAGGSFERVARWTGPVLIRQRIDEPTPVRDLVFDMCEPFIANVYVSEDGLVKLLMPIPAADGETVKTVTEGARPLSGPRADGVILEGPIKISHGELSRLTHVSIHYDWQGGDTYEGIAIAYNAVTHAAEAFGAGEAARYEKRIQTKWLQGWDNLNAELQAWRWLMRHEFPRRMVGFQVERRDEDLALGDCVDLTLSLLQDALGDPLTLRGRIVGKQRLDLEGFELTWQESGWGRSTATGQSTPPLFRADHRFAFWHDPSAADYDSEADHSRAFIGDTNNELGAAGDQGFYIP